MTNTDQIKILQENKLALTESFRWLQRSYAICHEQFDINELSDEGYDAFESLTSRFARTTDILTNKVFRSIIYLEEGASFSWLDTLLYLEKNGVVSSLDDARLIKELRNEIVHEYTVSDLKQLFIEVLNNCSKLFEFVETAQRYSDKLLNKLKS